MNLILSPTTNRRRPNSTTAACACSRSNKSCFITPLNLVNSVWKLFRMTSRMSQAEVYFSEALTWALKTINLNDFPLSTFSQFAHCLNFHPQKKGTSHFRDYLGINFILTWSDAKSCMLWIILESAALRLLALLCWNLVHRYTAGKQRWARVILHLFRCHFKLCWNSRMLCEGADVFHWRQRQW